MTQGHAGAAVAAEGPRSVVEIQQLTREYASFSQRRSGLGNVLGGAAGLVAFAAIWLFGHGVAAALLTVGLAMAWLVGKEVIRRRLYRSFGDAREAWPAQQRRGHVVVVSFLGVLLAGAAIWFVIYTLAGHATWTTTVPYLVFCAITPPIAWRYLRTMNELMIGIYLLFAGAIVCSGHIPNLLIFGAILPLYSLALIALGLREHRQFEELAARLRARGEAQA